MSTLYLPKNLAGLASVTAEPTRFTLNGVRLVAGPGNRTYRAEASDGRRLAVIRGPSLMPADFVPDPETEPAAIVPAADWKAGFKLGKKAPTVGLLVEGGGRSLTFGAEGQSLQAQALDGRFPPVNDILPKSSPLFSVTVNAALLRGLLDLAAALNEKGEQQAALHIFGGKVTLLGLTAQNAQGQYLDALLMPLELSGPSPRVNGRP